MDTDKITIEHIPAKALFRTVVDGVEAHVAYKSDGKSLDIRHTIVPEPIGGRHSIGTGKSRVRLRSCQ